MRTANPVVGGAPVRLLEGPVASLPAVRSAVVTTSILAADDTGTHARVISASCSACGRELPETHLQTLNQLGTGCPEESTIENCAECGGTKFRFRIQLESARHWIRVAERLAQTAPEVREAEFPKLSPASPKSATRWRLIAAAFLVGLGLFFILRYWIYGMPIPLIHKVEPPEIQLIQPSFEEETEVAPTEGDVPKANSRERE